MFQITKHLRQRAEIRIGHNKLESILLRNYGGDCGFDIDQNTNKLEVWSIS